MKYCLVRHCLSCTQWGTEFYEEVVYMNKNVKNMTYMKKPGTGNTMGHTWRNNVKWLPIFVQQ